MTTNDSPAQRPMGFLHALGSLIIIAVALLAGAALWPHAVKLLSSAPTILIASPTPGSAVRPTQPPRPTPLPSAQQQQPAQPAVAPVLSPAQLQDPAQNGNNVAPPGCQFPITGNECANGGAPNEDVQDGQKESPRGSVSTGDRPAAAPASDLIILPTVASPTDGTPPNPSKGQCLHGQVFTNHGCKNPEAVGP